MVVVYDIRTGNWINIVSGQQTQLERVKQSFPDQAEYLSEICLADDQKVLANPYAYRLLYLNGMPYRMFKKIKASVETNKYVLLGDGMDTAHIVITLDASTVHPLDDLSSVTVFINDTTTALDVVDFRSETDVVIQSPPTTLRISLDHNIFDFNPCLIEVV